MLVLLCNLIKCWQYEVCNCGVAFVHMGVFFFYRCVAGLRSSGKWNWSSLSSQLRICKIPVTFSCFVSSTYVRGGCWKEWPILFDLGNRMLLSSRQGAITPFQRKLVPKLREAYNDVRRRLSGSCFQSLVIQLIGIFPVNRFERSVWYSKSVILEKIWLSFIAAWIDALVYVGAGNE